MPASLGWIAVSLAGVADVWSVVWLGIRYAAQFGFIISAIGFFIVTIRKVSRFVDEQENIGRKATDIAADAKSFAHDMKELLSQHGEWLHELTTRVAVIEHDIGIDTAKEYTGEERRRRPHRKGDPEKRRGNDA